MIKDDTHIAWLVGYLSNTDETINGSFTYGDSGNQKISSNFADWAYSQYCNTAVKTIDEEDSRTFILIGIQKSRGYSSIYLRKQNSSVNTGVREGSFHFNPSSVGDAMVEPVNYNTLNFNTAIDALYRDRTDLVNEDIYNTLAELAGKDIQFNDGTYRFSINYTAEQEDTKEANNESNLGGNIITQVTNKGTALGATSVTPSRRPTAYRLYVRTFVVTAEKLPVSSTDYTYAITSSAKSLNDAPYKMIAIPYCTTTLPYTIDGIALSKELAFT